PRQIRCPPCAKCVRNTFMTLATITPELRVLAPVIAQQLGLILANLAALIAHALLRNPRYVGVIIPLWTRITRASRRFSSLIAPAVAPHVAPCTAPTVNLLPDLVWLPARPPRPPPAAAPAPSLAERFPGLCPRMWTRFPFRDLIPRPTDLKPA